MFRKISVAGREILIRKREGRFCNDATKQIIVMGVTRFWTKDFRVKVIQSSLSTRLMDDGPYKGNTQPNAREESMGSIISIVPGRDGLKGNLNVAHFHIVTSITCLLYHCE